MDKVVFRLEKKEDYRTVENMIRESFWNVYRPGCLEHFVIHELRSDPAFIPELDLVMEKDGEIIGQNMFMKTVIDADDGRHQGDFQGLPVKLVRAMRAHIEFAKQTYRMRAERAYLEFA